MSLTQTRLTLDEIFDKFHPESLSPQPSSPIVVYLFSHAVADSKHATQELPLDEHKNELDEYSETLDEIESLGWIERTDTTIKLTPTGVRVAGPIHSQIEREHTN